jgi:hypothetical protein
MEVEKLISLLEKAKTDRYQFLQWFNLTYKRPDAGAYGKTVASIHEIYEDTHPEAIWSLDDTKCMLIAVGAIDEGQDVINIVTRTDYLPENPDFLRKLLAIETSGPICAELLSRIRGEETARVIKSKHKAQTLEISNIKAEYSSLEEFLNSWCVRASAHPMLKLKDSMWRRSPVSKVIQAYTTFCKLHKYGPVTNKELWYFLESKGYRRGKGYACKISGCSYISDIYVPGCGEQGTLELAAAYILDEFTLTVSLVADNEVVESVLYNRLGGKIEPTDEQWKLIRKYCSTIDRELAEAIAERQSRKEAKEAVEPEERIILNDIKVLDPTIEVMMPDPNAGLPANTGGLMTADSNDGQIMFTTPEIGSSKTVAEKIGSYFDVTKLVVPEMSAESKEALKRLGINPGTKEESK